jgi:Mg2+-importing ATPase
MFKNITRLLARLNRHLPRRLVQRDPLPDAANIQHVEVPASLSDRCLALSTMELAELWQQLNSHPEGLNEKEVQDARENTALTRSPVSARCPGGRICGPAIATRLTCC